MGQQSDHKLAMRISRSNIFLNSLLSVSKLIVGVVAHSAAMINDGINNASDVISSVIVIIGVSAAAKESDEDHQYGHERLENVASILLSGIVIAVGVGLFADGIKKIYSKAYQGLPMPGMLAVIAAVSSIIIKEIMFLYTRWGSKKT
ncbi:MAG: cation diffusion facilitator family transporter, partial [Sphaerochaeta sp.]